MNNTPKVSILSSEIKGRLFIGGDIHGMYGLLIQTLKNMGFDFNKDVFVCTGDLVDRGGLNEECVSLIDEPWFKSVRGNHEQLLISSFNNSYCKEIHLENGGEWFHKLDQIKKIQIAKKLDTLPYLIEINYKGLKIGVAHANIYGDDWEALKNKLLGKWFFGYNEKKLEGYTLWNRDRIDPSVRCNQVKNIDYVFLGHNIVRKPCKRDNVFFIDTGAYASLNMTIINIDSFFDLI